MWANSDHNMFKAGFVAITNILTRQTKALERIADALEKNNKSEEKTDESAA